MNENTFVEMVDYFTERGLTVPVLFEQFASDIVNEPGTARWRIGTLPAVWPFDPTSEFVVIAPTPNVSFTPFVSVRFTLYEPWDDIDDSYGDAVIELRLVTRELLLQVRISESRRVLKGGGNAWQADADSEWIPLWNEAMRDLALYTEKVDVSAQFENPSETVTPEFAINFDTTQNQIVSFTIAGGPESAIDMSYLDGPPTLGEILLDDEDDHHGSDADGDDVIEFLDNNELADPPFFADFYQFVERDAVGLGWHLRGGPDIDPMDDYMQMSFQTVLENPISPQLALNHAGHGTNSYGLNLRMQVGAVLIVAQYGWGGVYMDGAEQRDAWNAGMDALHEFFNEIDLNVDIFAPPAPREIEVAIRFSEFRGSTALVRDESGEMVELDLSGCKTLQDVLDVVLENEADTWGLF